MATLKLSLRRDLTFTTDTDGFVPCIYLPSADRNFQYDAAHGFGWDTIFDGSRDRGTNGASQLHGIHFASSPRYFRIDLPAGTGGYKVYAVCCDQTGSAVGDWDFFDGNSSTAFHSMTGTTTGGSDTLDIGGNHVSVSSWTIAGNDYVTHTFTQNYMIFKPSTNGAEISAVWLESDESGASNYSPFRNAKYINKTYQIPRFG